MSTGYAKVKRFIEDDEFNVAFPIIPRRDELLIIEGKTYRVDAVVHDFVFGVQCAPYITIYIR